MTTKQGEIPAAAVVCAAGVWSNEIARSAGVELPVRPRKGHILVTSRAPGLIAHPMLEGSYAASVTVRGRGGAGGAGRRDDGRGHGAPRQQPGVCGVRSAGVSPAVVQAIAARALRFLPGLAQASIIRSYAGLRPWSPDHLPLVGPVATRAGLLPGDRSRGRRASGWRR